MKSGNGAGAARRVASGARISARGCGGASHRARRAAHCACLKRSNISGRTAWASKAARLLASPHAARTSKPASAAGIAIIKQQ